MVQPKGKARDIAHSLLNKTKAEQKRRDKPDKLQELAFHRDMSSFGMSRNKRYR